MSSINQESLRCLMNRRLFFPPALIAHTHTHISAVLFRRNVQRFVELSLSCQARYRLIPGMTS